MEKNRIILSLGIWGFDDISHEEISNLLELTPTKTYVVGEKRNPNNPNSPLIKRNGWIIDATDNQYFSFLNNP